MNFYIGLKYADEKNSFFKKSLTGFRTTVGDHHLQSYAAAQSDEGVRLCAILTAQFRTKNYFAITNLAHARISSRRLFSNVVLRYASTLFLTA
jgi:hypothetical protein